MIISVSINTVLRDVLSKFEQLYEKYEDREVKSPVITPNSIDYTHFEKPEDLYDFLYTEAPMEIFGQATETITNIVSHLVELYKDMPSDYKLRVVSDDLGKAKSATLWFLAKYGLVCDEIVFYNTKSVVGLWESTDIFITSDVDVIKTKPKDKKLIVIDHIYNSSYDCDLRIDSLKELDSLNINNMLQLEKI